jgi:tRNA pseudouridine38-40 synthase
VSYDGGPFSGCARQHGVRTIAGEIDGAVRAIDPKASLVRVCSRTDAGVHAVGQRIAFDSVREIDPRGWALALMRHLPREIAIRQAAEIGVGFEPSIHSLKKTYRYRFYQSDLRDPFLVGRAWRVPERLNHSLMVDVAQSLVGEHDFAAFRAAADERKETVRNILRIEVRKDRRDERLFEVLVEGNRFMYRMVRIIVGTLVDIGRNRLPASAVVRALESRQRRDLGMTAPAEGLYLDRIVLDDEGTGAWPPLESLTDSAGIDGSIVVA